jgi:hypothetical protein
MRDTIDMAREAGFGIIDAGFNKFGACADGLCQKQLKAFEALVRADEREACAKVCDELRGINWGPEQCATAIRARGETK